VKRKGNLHWTLFNLRTFIALLISTTGISLVVAAASPFGRGIGQVAPGAKTQQKAHVSNQSKDPLIPVPIDCSRVYELGIDKMENFAAQRIMIACGFAEGGSASVGGKFSRFVQNLLPAPLTYGATDIDLITGTETSPRVTQSETFSWANPDDPNQIVVAYNDSRGAALASPNYSGASVSTDGGNTFARLTKASGQSPFGSAGINLGDPVVLYNRQSQTWFTIWLDCGCGCGLPFGSSGLGYYKSTTPWDPNSWTHGCVHNNVFDDRESAWVDNNPSSPFYGRMYVSWNDFGRSAAIFVRYSTDNGITWTNERQINSGSSFVRNVQITGDFVTGDVYIAGMDEGDGGFPHDCNNLLYRSSDGGNSWVNTYTGPAFSGPGRSSSGYFATMYDNPPYWRHQGWGQPAARDHVVHYVYAARNPNNGDPGDVFYIRSTDSGVTFSSPFPLNATTDPTKAQWQPNISVSPAGTLFAVWYDEAPRLASSCQPSGPSTPCYQMHGRKSTDNGVTWSPDDTFSDTASPLPLQPDPNIQDTYAGDYDYGSAIFQKHLSSWCDGRAIISGVSQQDAFTDRELVGFAVTTTDPACGSLIFIRQTAFVINLSDPVDPATLSPSALMVNGSPADTVTLSQNNTMLTFNYNTSPVVNNGLQTIHIAAAAFQRAADHSPVLEFNCTFHYDETPLTVASTNPPVGGTFTGPGTVTYDVNWNEAIDPNSVQTSDLQLSGVPAIVQSVQLINGNTTIRFTVNFTSNLSGTVTVTIVAGALSDLFGNPNIRFTGSYNYQGTICDSGMVQNGGFETGTFGPWIIDGSSNAPVITNTQTHSGTFAAFAGGNPQAGYFCSANGQSPAGSSSFYQEFTVPPGDGTLRFWYWTCSADFINFDWQDAYITDTNGNILQTIFHQCTNNEVWVSQAVNMSPYAGQTVRIKFLVHQDGSNPYLTGMYVDDVTLYVPCGSPSPSPTETPTPTATPTSTPTPTITPTPSPTARPSPTLRPHPTQRPRPTPRPQQPINHT
jgi:hypothetical protein